MKNTNKENDIIMTYILPIISSIGFVLSAISFLIFSSSIFKELLYKYVKIQTIFCSFYLLIQALRPVESCVKCQISQTLASVIYFIYFAVYVVSICEFSAFAFQIFSAIHCYIMINSLSIVKYKFIMSFKLMCILTFVLSCLLFSFQLFEFEIASKNQTDNGRKFYPRKTAFWYSNGRKFCEIFAILLRDLLGMVSLLSINLILFINIKNKLKLKKKLLNGNLIKKLLNSSVNRVYVKPLSVEKSPSSTSSPLSPVVACSQLSKNNPKHFSFRLTLMTCLNCLNCLFGRLLISFYFILRNLNVWEEDGYIDNIILKFSILFISLSYSLNFILFYFTNKKFKKIVNRMFHISAVSVKFYSKKHVSI